MKKPENYDWNMRTIRQFKESIISNDFYIIEKDEYLSDNILASFIECDDMRDIIKLSTLVLKSKIESDESFYLVILLDVNIKDQLKLMKKKILELPEHYCMNNEVHFCSFIIDVDSFTEDFHAIMESIIPDYEDYISNIISTCMESPFKYPIYDNERLKKYFKLIIDACNSNDNKLPYNGRVNYNDILIKNFHHSIYDTSIDKKPSMSEAWNDINLLMESIYNRIMYKNFITESIIRDGLNIAKIAPKPSIISTKHALLLSSNLFNDCNTILDPIVGFSGKLIASILLGKTYTGIYDYGLDHNYEV